MAAPEPVNTSASSRGASSRALWRPRVWGWLRVRPIVLVLLAMAPPLGITLYVVAPRAVRPSVMPLPALSQIEVFFSRRRDQERAERLVVDESARALFAALRAFGAEEADAGGVSAERLSAMRAAFARHAATRGDDQADAARAKLAADFVTAIERADEGQVRALGGTFRDGARRSGLLRADGTVDGAIADSFTVSSTYKLRLAFLAGDPPDSPRMSRAERIVAEGFILASARPRTATLGRRLRAIEVLGSLDARYPVTLARGVLFARLRRFAEAEGELLEYRRGHPYDPRVRNHLIWLRRKLDGR